VRVHTARSLPSLSSTATAGNRLVVPKTPHGLPALDVAPEPKGQVVAIALRGGAGMEGTQDDIGHALRGEDVAAYNGGFVAGGEE